MSSWHERLSLWWSFDTLERASLDWNRCWFKEINYEHRTLSDFYEYQSLGMILPKRFATEFETLDPLRTSMVRTGASLWRKFAAPSPLLFDRARQNGCAAFPDLTQVAERYRIYFPCAEASGESSLKLSEYDQLLFENLESKSWLNAIKIFSKRQKYVSFFFEDGDLANLCRLKQWAKHRTRMPALEVRHTTSRTNAWTFTEYRLTAHGERLRAEGLRLVDEAPQMYVGGCKLFAKDRIWVRRIQGDDWWIEEMVQ